MSEPPLAPSDRSARPFLIVLFDFGRRRYFVILSLYTAAAGMNAQQFHIDTISNNLANVNTTAYKRARPEFQDLLYLTVRRPVAPQTPVGLNVGLGVYPAASQTIFQQGDLQPTENPLDVAISGRGFFVVRGPSGEVYYTRDGSFKRDSSGALVTSDGNRVEVAGARPLPDTDSIIITRDGRLTFMDDQGNEVDAGSLVIVQFDNPAGLEKVGHNLYRASTASGAANRSLAGSSIEQGYLEASNVQVVDELVSLITAQRAYELNAKAVQASDEMLSIVNNLRR